MQVWGYNFYIESIILALHALKRKDWKQVLHRVSNIQIYRYFENSWIFNNLDVQPGQRILDVGSPKVLFFFIGKRVGPIDVVACDILDRQRELASLLDYIPNVNKARFEIQDARQLDYPSNCFDRIFSLSVIEHIPERGDIEAMSEFYRVLRPGGKLIVTVPYSMEYEIEYHETRVYERKYEGTPLFFQRRYNEEQLHSRLLTTPLKLLKKEYITERFTSLYKHVISLPKYLNPIQMILLKLGSLFTAPLMLKLTKKPWNSTRVVCLLFTK